MKYGSSGLVKIVKRSFSLSHFQKGKLTL
jgi:glutamine synthetase